MVAKCLSSDCQSSGLTVRQITTRPVTPLSWCGSTGSSANAEASDTGHVGGSGFVANGCLPCERRGHFVTWVRPSTADELRELVDRRRRTAFHPCLARAADVGGEVGAAR
jgi:hypothetical protein